VKVFQYLIYACGLLIVVGGAGTVAGFVARAERARLPFMWILVGGLGLFAATLVFGVIAGAYLYFFTDRRSLQYFSKRGDESPLPPLERR
jgi:hypothetical protein